MNEYHDFQCTEYSIHRNLRNLNYAVDQKEAMFHIPLHFKSFVKEDRKRRKEEKLPDGFYVIPSTMWFATKNICNVPIKADYLGIYHVLYSMHSDYFEMKEFIKKLNVRQLMPFNDPFMLSVD